MVALFSTCLGDHLAPRIARDAARVLAVGGCSVARPRDATCCGQPAWNSGFAAPARRVARTTLHALAGYEAVVVPAGSCAAMMRLHWPALFRGDRDEALAGEVAGRVHELSEYLADVLRVELPAAPALPAATYHDSCHMLRELRVREQPRRLLALVADVREMPAAERCCGFGGAFSARYPELSTAMADDKLASASASGADTVVSCDPGCLLQIGGRAAHRGLPLRARHLATVLAGALS